MGRWLWIVACGLWPVAWAHDPITTKLTWTREISRIVYKHCVSCHRAGGAAPMSLVAYEEARPWAKAIKEEVLERRMPPWGAVKGFGEFRDDQGLSQEEIELIADWVEGGAPDGDPQYLPSQPRAAAGQAPEPRGREVSFQSSWIAKQEAVLEAIRPQLLPAGASVQVVAIRADTSVEPLIWIRKYNPKWQRTYVLRAPLRLAPGTRIQAIPPAGVGTLALVLAGQPKR